MRRGAVCQTLRRREQRSLLRIDAVEPVDPTDPGAGGGTPGTGTPGAGSGSGAGSGAGSGSGAGTANGSDWLANSGAQVGGFAALGALPVRGYPRGVPPP